MDSDLYDIRCYRQNDEKPVLEVTEKAGNDWPFGIGLDDLGDIKIWINEVHFPKAVLDACVELYMSDGTETEYLEPIKNMFDENADRIENMAIGKEPYISTYNDAKRHMQEIFGILI